MNKAVASFNAIKDGAKSGFNVSYTLPDCLEDCDDKQLIAYTMLCLGADGYTMVEDMEIDLTIDKT